MGRSDGNRRGRRRKVGPGLMALGSSVVLAAYGAGWMETQAYRADLLQPLANEDLPPLDTRSPRAAVPAPGDAIPPSTSPTASDARPTATPAAAWRDGKYTGRGESVHGGVTVAIVIAGSRIASAQIVVCDTRYACSEIDSLSDQVVERQSARLRYVSGATDSSRAYVKAIEAALAKASA
jgi:uncharacterized protein with FMN-binding domain